MSNTQYYPPIYSANSFNCPYCGVYALQYWYKTSYYFYNEYRELTSFELSKCAHCDKFSYWYDQALLIPSMLTTQLPHSDMPEICKKDYMEAREVFPFSPRASAALLRLCIQNLMMELGEGGKNINNDIGSLVKKGMPEKIQKALDICRVVGNNAVHPGEINLNDSPDIAEKLFDLVNFIVQERITRLNAIDDLYEQLPESSRDQIVKRDSS